MTAAKSNRQKLAGTNPEIRLVERRHFAVVQRELARHLFDSNECVPCIHRCQSLSCVWFHPGRYSGSNGSALPFRRKAKTSDKRRRLPDEAGSSS